MLELPKRDLKELPGLAMHVLHRAGIRSCISNVDSGSALAALEQKEPRHWLHQGRATLLSNPERTKSKPHLALVW